MTFPLLSTGPKAQPFTQPRGIRVTIAPSRPKGTVLPTATAFLKAVVLLVAQWRRRGSPGRRVMICGRDWPS